MSMGIGSYGQFNVAIGYKAGFTAFKANNDLLSAYAPSTGLLQKPFSDLHFLHGIELGFRYRFSNWAVEAGWGNLGRERNALIFIPSNETFLSREYDYDVSAFHLELDNYIGNLGIGSSFISRKLSISRKIDNNKIKLVSERQIALQVHLVWIVQKGTAVSFGIKPYYQFGLDKFGLQALGNDLGIPNGSVNTNDPLNIFGLSFVFYNGKQDSL